MTASPWENSVRGPWITGSYYRNSDDTKFQSGWLRTGDVGRIDPQGYITLTDRARTSSRAVANGSPPWNSRTISSPIRWCGKPPSSPCPTNVAGAAAGGRCAEAPAPSTPGVARLPGDKVAKWWLPERWTFLEEIPRTSVGKVRQEGHPGPPRRRRLRGGLGSPRTFSREQT